MIPRWMIRIMDLAFGRHEQGRHHDANVTFVSSSVDLWDTFAESSAVQKLLLLPNEESTPPTASEWQEQLIIAFRLIRDMDLEGKLAMNTIDAVLHRLILGTYFAQHNYTPSGDNNQDQYLLHALIAITRTVPCPDFLFNWIVENARPEQLHIVDPIHGQLPLAAACSFSHSHPDRILTLLHAHPQAASVADAQGRYPLYLACCSRLLSWEHGIRQVFQAAPDVLRLSAVNGQSLFVSTALAHVETVLQHNAAAVDNTTNTLFQLLRNDPTVLRDFV